MAERQRAYCMTLEVPGDDRRWSLAPVISWLIGEGRLLVHATALIDGLGQRLLEAGAPVSRLRLAFGTVHPQVAALGYTWTPDSPTREVRVPHGFRSSDDYVGSPVQQVFETRRRYRRRLAGVDPERDHSVLVTLARSGMTDYCAMPMVFSGGSVSSFIVATGASEGFSDADLARFGALAEFVAPVLEVIAQRRVAEALLDTYVGHRTGGRVLQGSIKRGDGELIHAALWFSDLREFTAMTETLAPDRLLETLNTYFETVAAAVTARGGEILRFIGDAMLIVFPAESDEQVRRACDAALEAALDAFSGLAAMNHRRRRAGHPEIRFGVGLHVGQVIYGNVGAPDRLDFTVMGPAVNRTARLESLTKEVGARLLLSDEFARHVEHDVRSLGHFEMKGVREPQEVFALVEESEAPAA